MVESLPTILTNCPMVTSSMFAVCTNGEVDNHTLKNDHHKKEKG